MGASHQLGSGMAMGVYGGGPVGSRGVQELGNYATGKANFVAFWGQVERLAYFSIGECTEKINAG